MGRVQKRLMPEEHNGPPRPTAKTLGHYEIVSPLGEGGMGVVYKGRDTHLDRFVALKTLRRDVVTDPDRRRRFVLEAKAASALNHPNIVHVYDIATQDGMDYIAMEYVAGPSLSQWVKGNRPPAGEILDCAIQIATGLDAAHRAGIIHRDLKPANIIIAGPSSAQPGLVKILDFGLAKLMEAEPLGRADADSQTLSVGVARSFDTIVGTPGYMSPEQLAGMHVDQRSDIFAFGLVVYYLATGQNAFHGGSSGLVIAALLRDDPPAPSDLAPDIDRGLEAVILRCIRKDPDRRFQSMLEVKSALEDLREQVPSGRRTRSLASLEPLHKSFPLWTVALSLLVLAASAGLWFWRSAPPKTLEPVLQRLTTDSGLSLDPAISRDAKMLAYASDRSGEGNLDIWVRQVAGGDPIRITNTAADDNEPDFSSDGTTLAFHSDREGGGLYVVSVLGGQQRRLADGGRRPRYSPDGKQIAYWTGEPYRDVPWHPRAAAIYVIDAAGGTPRRLAADFAIATRPLWTPDGSHILFWGSKQALPPGVSTSTGGGPRPGWWVTPGAGGTAVAVASASADFGVEEMANSEPCGWRNGNIIFATRTLDNMVNVYETPFSLDKWEISGPIHRLTLGTTKEESPSVAADGRLVFASIAANLDVYSLPLDVNRGKALAAPERLTRDMADDTGGWPSADGRMMAFESIRSGQWEIWIKDLIGGESQGLALASGAQKAPALAAPGKERMLTSGRDPVMSPDGASIVFQQDKKLMLISSAGGASRVLSQRPLRPSGWSPDESLVLAADYNQPRTVIETVEVASGKESVYLSDPRRNLYPRGFSPDGRWIVFTAASPEGQATMVAPFRPSAPPSEREWLAVTDSLTNDFVPRWSPDGRTLYFISERDGFACLWARRMDPATQTPLGDAFPVLHLHGAALRMRTAERDLAIAKDKVIFSLEERSGSIWMLQFR
jgi:serine/threonine protein kinase/Tol biopolymer transport system component